MYKAGLSSVAIERLSSIQYERVVEQVHIPCSRPLYIITFLSNISPIPWEDDRDGGTRHRLVYQERIYVSSGFGATAAQGLHSRRTSSAIYGVSLGV